MKMIKRKSPQDSEITTFIKQVDFNIPKSYLKFFKETNGAEIFTEVKYIILWQIDLLCILNEEYQVINFLPGFFLIGAKGDEIGYAIQKDTGKIFEVPFIGMSLEEAVMCFIDFDDLLKNYKE